MSARPKKKAAPKQSSRPSYRMMVMNAIAAQSHFGHGASRAAIANYIKANNQVGQQSFTANVRRALNGLMDDKMIVHGDTVQRYKLTDKGRDARKPNLENHPDKQHCISL